MEPEVHWNYERGGDSYQMPGPDHLGRWAAVAMVLSILLHVVLFFALDRIKIVMGFAQPEELVTGPVNVRRVEVKPYVEESAPPVEEMVVPPDDTAPLMEEIDLLDLLPENVEIDISPEVMDPEYALKLSNPLASGEVDAFEVEASKHFDLESELPDFGRMESDLTPAAVGQITVDPGALQLDEDSTTAFTDDLIKKGNQGLVENGSLDGIESLDALLDLPENLLLSKKTMLPSDLLFEFNRAELRESAKVGLMKLGLLMDKNPDLYCWIEGHTDLIGGHQSNVELSKRRAEAVKTYLVESMRMDPRRIYTLGYGKTKPLITSGDAEAQAPNRRVEIKMRKAPPTELKLIEVTEAEPVEVIEEEEPVPPEPVLVRPQRAVPVDEEELNSEEEAPRAVPVPERAIPVDEPELPDPAPLRAEPVDP
jgi:OmpA-OmpF porin, OOP family